MSTKLTKLLQSNLKVFTLDDLGIIWGQKSRSATRQSARDYASRGSLIRLRQGVYALPHVELDSFMVANKLLAPSYITGLSVLIDAGLSFQFTSCVFSAASYNKKYELGEKTFVYSQVKESILFNSLGLNDTGPTSIAGVERAMCDLVYLNKGRYPFEGFEGINWELMDSCAKIYECSFVPIAIKALKEQNAG